MAAKVVALLLLLIVITVLVPVESIDKEELEMINGIDKSNQKVMDSVIASVPQEQKTKATEAVFKLMVIASGSFGLAEGDKKKVAALVDAYKKAGDEVLAAPPADKLAVMEKTFKATARTAYTCECKA